MANTKTKGRKRRAEHNHTPPQHTPLFITHTTLPFSTHNTATQRGSGQHDTSECNTKKTRQCEVPDLNRRQGTLRRGRGQHETRGQHNNTPHPAIQQSHRVNDKGDANTQKGDTTHKTGRPATQPPFPHHATHHPLCHPTIHDGPTHHHDEGGARRGYPTTRTPQTHAHHPHTTHLAMNTV